VIDEGLTRGKGGLYALDPRIKIIALTIYSFIVALEKEWIPLLYASLLPVFLLFISSRSTLKAIIKRILPVNGFVLLLWITMPFTYSGDKILTIGYISLSREGVDLCLLITAKANLIFITTFLFLTTSPVMHLVHALHHIRLPKKLVQLFYFSYRYIPVIHKEYSRLYTAMKLRGFNPKNNIHTYRSFGNLIGMIFLRAYERSKRIYQAMLLRGFRGIFWTFYHFEWKRADSISCILLAIYLSGFLWLKWR